MQTAIDRLITGKEFEIDISEFDGNKSQNRFICPECGNYVFPAVGKKNSFRHYKNSGLDCERRANNDENLSFYQKVGLPIYIAQTGNFFSLYIGFYALGFELLQQTQQSNFKVFIKQNSSSPPEEHLVDFTFFENETTLKKLNEIPLPGSQYEIIFPEANNAMLSQIKQRWSNYADGFSNMGAIFSYSEQHGKKYRVNDTITIKTEYYLVLYKNETLPYNGLKMNYLGLLKLKNLSCYVYKMYLDPATDKDFMVLEGYFEEAFKIKLLYKKPRLIQLWPPAAITDDSNLSIQLGTNNEIFCMLNSSAENPKVYSYKENSYTQYPWKNIQELKYLTFPLAQIPRPFSVDRKYLANASTFSWLPKIDTKNNIDISIGDKSYHIDNLLEIRNLSQLDIKENKAEIVSNIKIVLTEESNLYFPSIDFLSIFRKEDTCNTSYYQNKKLDITIAEVIRGLNSEKINIPLQYRQIYKIIKKTPQLQKLFKEFIYAGIIPKKSLEALIHGGFFND